jgi:hypothetical protein
VGVVPDCRAAYGRGSANDPLHPSDGVRVARARPVDGEDVLVAPKRKDPSERGGAWLATAETILTARINLCPQTAEYATGLRYTSPRLIA